MNNYLNPLDGLKNNAFFVCTTPFQVMSAISLVLTNNEIADICVDFKFEGYNDFLARLAKRNIFRKIIDINSIPEIKFYRKETNSFFKSLKLIKLFTNIQKIGEKIFENKANSLIYVYASCDCFAANLLRAYLGACKEKYDIIYFDDGEGSYDNFPKRKSLLKKFFFHIFSIKSMINTTVKKYLYAPFVYNTIQKDNHIILQMPLINSLPKIFNEIKYIFNIENVVCIKQRYIYLDIIANDVLPSNEIENYRLLISKLNDICGDFCLKRHPRDNSKIDTNIEVYKDKIASFEAICMSSEMSNKVLITLSSTAVFTPKLLFNQEPYVILLYKLFNVKIASDKDRDLFYNGLIKLYNNPNKIIIPSSREELFSIIKSLNKI